MATFNSLKDALKEYERTYEYGTAIALNPVIHGVTLYLHVYRLGPILRLKTQADVNNIFKLCTANDCSTQVIIAERIIISSGVTLTPPKRCKGIVLWCNDVLENNGSISMTSKGCVAAGQNIYLTDTDFVPARGANPGWDYWCGANGQCHNGNPGSHGVNRQSGGGVRSRTSFLAISLCSTRWLRHILFRRCRFRRFPMGWWSRIWPTKIRTRF